MLMPKTLVHLLFSSCFKLSHYLDIVEVQIAQQVAQKSEAFFIAMTSHDALMEQLTQTINVVKALR
jgi:vacuolar protein sorting-associated protein 54